MFILETMVPRVELEGVSAACTNDTALTVTVQKLASSVKNKYSSLSALEDTDGLEVGRGAALSRNAKKNQNKRNCANGGNSGGAIFDIP